MIKTEKKKRGRKPNHPPIRIIENGEIYPTYQAVADRIQGHRGDVRLCLIHQRNTHRGFTFEYVRKMDD